LAIANMTALSSATSPQILSVVSVVMPATWRGIVQTDRGVQTGVMMVVVFLGVVLQEGRLAKVMRLIGSTR
jgi:hypothetical protein